VLTIREDGATFSIHGSGQGSPLEWWQEEGLLGQGGSVSSGVLQTPFASRRIIFGLLPPSAIGVALQCETGEQLWAQTGGGAWAGVLPFGGSATAVFYDKHQKECGRLSVASATESDALLGRMPQGMQFDFPSATERGLQSLASLHLDKVILTLFRDADSAEMLLRVTGVHGGGEFPLAKSEGWADAPLPDGMRAVFGWLPDDDGVIVQVSGAEVVLVLVTRAWLAVGQVWKELELRLTNAKQELTLREVIEARAEARCEIQGEKRRRNHISEMPTQFSVGRKRQSDCYLQSHPDHSG
jgi:hypothetical protein